MAIIKAVRIKYAALKETDDNDKFKVIFTFDDDDDCEALKDQIDAFWKENKPKGAKKPRNLPYFISEPSDEYPDDEDEGRLIFIASKNETSKEGKDLGGVQVIKKNGVPYGDDDVPTVGGGTVANLSTDMFCWTHKRDHGVSLWLNKLQVLDLVEFSGGDEFGDESEGADNFDDDKAEKKDKKKKKKNKKNKHVED